MRRVFNSLVRGVAAVTVIVVLAGNVSAAPRERGAKDKVPPVVKLLKSIVRSLGDGLIIPLP
ncbi:MAG TPA: hypothetical protein VEO54_20210 [Thermoanaerobaculia bacterium]|nr:hypothetical protein [Thermoanaerobaculia bacterium]